MKDGGALIGSFGVDLHGNLVVGGVVAGISSLGDEARELGEPLRAAERLDVLIQDLIDRERVPSEGGTVALHIVGIFRRGAVLFGEAGDNFRVIAAAMAGVAGDLGLAAEVGLIDGPHHENHFAGGLLEGRIVGISRPVVVGRFDVAIGAVQAEGGGKEAHRAHEFVHGNSFEHLDILEDLLRHGRFFGWGLADGRTLSACGCKAEQACEAEPRGAKKVRVDLSFIERPSYTTINSARELRSRGVLCYRVKAHSVGRLLRAPTQVWRRISDCNACSNASFFIESAFQPMRVLTVPRSTQALILTILQRPRLEPLRSRPSRANHR